MSANVSPSPSAERGAVLFSILIPVYNEQAYLARVVERVLAAPLPDGVERELILVDDCSTDRTPEVIASLVARYPEKIRAFRQPKNQGKGAAIRRAIQETRGDYAIIQDADLEYNPNEYSLVLAPLLDGRADVVYGSRFATRETRKIVNYHHKLGNLFLTHLSNWTTGLDLTDMETCYKAFRADVLKSIPLRSNRFGIEPEVTAKIAKRGWTVYEVPISYNGRRYSEGKKIGWKDGVSAIRTIVKYWLVDDCFYDGASDGGAAPTFERSRLSTKATVAKSVPFLGLRTLEIGAAQGEASRYLPQKERLTLADADEKNVKFLRAGYDGNAVVDVARLDLDAAVDKSAPLLDFSDVSQTPERALIAQTPQSAEYDAIVAFNRVDALCFDDAQAFGRLRSLLKSNGRVVFTLPACGSESYSEREIKRNLAAAGFRAEKIERFDALAALLERRDDKAPSRKALKLYDWLFRWTRWLDKFLPGARLFVVATPDSSNVK
ncbi:MAG: glycosyltransferase family 2 protein [Thermoguttaceae bacterium]|nr:glycosyltransferase family 2 protein [Thermoguttaceae bacterium]